MHKNAVIYQNVIGKLIGLSADITTNVEDLNPCLASFIREYRVVGIRVPRQTGLTHYQIDQLHKLQDCLLVVDNDGMRDAFFVNAEYGFGAELTDETRRKIITKQQLLDIARYSNTNEEKVKAPGVLFIDMAQSYDTEDLDVVYGWLAASFGRGVQVILFN